MTVLIDDFNTADSNILGHQLAPWGKNSNNANNFSNQARFQDTSSGNFARADSNLATVNHYSQAVMVNIPSGNLFGLIARWDATAWTDAAGPTQAYAFFYGGGAGSIYKYISASPTLLNSTSFTASAGDTVRMEVNGTSISIKVNSSVVQGPITDSAIATGLRCGIYGFQSGAAQLIDNFETGDLVTGTVRRNSSLNGLSASGLFFQDPIA